MNELPLKGVRVVDLCMYWAGPFATEVLAMLGAEVIKVESIQRMDNLRVMGMMGAPRTLDWYEWAPLFNTCNHNKLGITLDLTSKRGRELFEQLVAKSDVVAENYSVRVMKNVGLTYERLSKVRPELIMLSMPGYGHSGPFENYVSFGPSYEMYGGVAMISGYEDGPPMMQSGMSDPMGGITAACALLIALEHRRSTGKGQYIDLSQVETLTCMAPEPILQYSITGKLMQRNANRHPNYAPHGCYPASGADQWVSITVATDKEWRRLCEVAGKPEWTSDPRFAGAASRLAHYDELDGMIGQWTSGHDKVQLAVDLQKVGVSAAPVNNIFETLTDGQLRDRSINQKLERKPNGVHDYPAFPLVLDGQRPAINSPTPRLGEHNREVFQGILGLSDEEIEELRRQQVIGEKPIGL